MADIYIYIYIYIYIPWREASRYIFMALFTDPEGDICFSIYQISSIKMKKNNFFVN